MKHIIVEITYTQSIEKIDEHLHAHRNFLDEGYKKNILLASGPQNPRTGGIVIARTESLEELRSFFRQDPFSLNQCADYKFIEFIPVKFHSDHAGWFQPEHFLNANQLT